MKKSIISALLATALLVGCTPSHKKRLDINLRNLEPQTLSVKQYEKVLFEADSASFVEAMKAAQPDFMPFLGGDLNNPRNISFLWNYVADTLNRHLYTITKNAFPDITKVEDILLPIYKRFGYYFPELELPTPYTYISGVNLEMPILLGEDAVAIGLDNYLGTNQELYRRMQFPLYRIQRTEPVYIGRDFALAVHDAMAPNNNRRSNLLSEMIYGGKRLYFVEALNPNLPDSVLLGYTASQTDWALLNEGNIWSTIIGENLLYSTDNEIIQKFIGDGPFTAEFSKDSPARLGEFIGLQIVRSLMSADENLTLEDLMRCNDNQLILSKARYKPRK